MRSNYREGRFTREEPSNWRDRSPAGPWHREPDWAAWNDDYSGYDCAAQRNNSGAWCGYVFLPEGHPIDTPKKKSEPDDDGFEFGGDLTQGDPVWLDVHGGVTWHRGMDVPEAGLSGTAVGFDTAHSGDRSPTDGWAGGTYCDLEYVILEVTNMAEQISEYGRLEQLIQAGRE